MRVKRKSYAPYLIGKEGKIIGRIDNTLQIQLDSGEVCDDLYWNWIPLDDIAKKYIEVVERTAIPLTTPIDDG